MKSNKTLIFQIPIIFFILLLFCSKTFAQKDQTDSMKINRQNIYAYCLDGNVMPALKILSSYDDSKLNDNDLKFKTDIVNRFGYEEDRSVYPVNGITQIQELLEIYKDYWRMSLLSDNADNSGNYESLLKKRVSDFLSAKFPSETGCININNDDSTDVYLKKYISSNGLHTTGFGKTGKFFDLLVWNNQEDTAFTFSLHGEETGAKVVFMEDFITLGWEEYATLGRYYPGGWATSDALYCVKSAYDTESENFKISYLAHESRHFSDYKLFPKLKSADLEYRAKLTELSMAENTLFQTIEFFIKNSNYESDNGHSVANYCVMRDMSIALFNSDFEKDMNKWKGTDNKIINNTAYELLKANTEALKKHGADVEVFIKK